MSDRTVDCLICVHSKDDSYDSLLKRAVTSVLSGSIKPNRLVIVFDACHIYSQQTLEDYLAETDLLTGVEYIPLSKTVKNGLANAKNFGLKFCDSNYITFCDADDQWTHDKLELQLQYLRGHAIIRQNIDFLSTEVWDIYPNGEKRESYYKCGEYETHFQIQECFNRNENPLAHGSMIINKNALDKLNGYRDIRGQEDFDLWKRAMMAGYIFGKMPVRAYLYSMGTSVAR